MGNTPFFRRYAMPLCIFALLCSVHASFAQSPPDNSSLIGTWELVSVEGDETKPTRETIEIAGETLKIRVDCNGLSYTYTVRNGEITAQPPELTTSLACSDIRSKYNQDFIAAAIAHSKIELSGDTLKLSPVKRSIFTRNLEFHRMN